jgi:hypothetical protein
LARPTTPPYGDRSLEPGHTGLDVWELQLKLIGWGSGTKDDGIGQTNDPVRITGTYDDTTRDAVRRFQKAHGLAVHGVVDGPTFRAIDREAAHHPVLVADLQCPCVTGKNDGDILCRCTKHPSSGKCAGFGSKRFAGKFLLDDHTTLKTEKLRHYDMEEPDGVDKAALWAARALIHRAALAKVKVVAGYRCWHENYHTPDDLRARHSRSTLGLGKSLELVHPGTCTFVAGTPCAECERIRKVATELCGFQLRWHESGRPSVGEGKKDARAPVTPHSVHLDTLLREVTAKDRVVTDFVKTDADALAPLYANKVVRVSYPVDLGAGTEPTVAPTGPFFANIEAAKGGWFPIGSGGLWHGGTHLTVNAGTAVRAIADGEIVGFMAGEDEQAKAHGSRNFVLVKHTWAKHSKDFYSLYMHLDGEKADGSATVAWAQGDLRAHRGRRRSRGRQPHLRLRRREQGPRPQGTDRPRARRARGGERGSRSTRRPSTRSTPAGSKVVQLATAGEYVYTSRGGTEVAKLQAADATLAGKLTGKVVGLEKPIPVSAGEVIGKVAKAATHASLSGLGAFLHLEVFAADALLTGTGYVAIDASDAAKAADRTEVAKALVAAKLLAKPVDDVLTARGPGGPVHEGRPARPPAERGPEGPERLVVRLEGRPVRRQGAGLHEGHRPRRPGRRLQRVPLVEGGSTTTRGSSRPPTSSTTSTRSPCSCRSPSPRRRSRAARAGPRGLRRCR